ncbi:hypothetical protein P9112_009555 [Eukaryota sp. TZLM1-RC]
MVVQSNHRTNHQILIGVVRISHLHFVDLAGSEGASQTGAKGTQLKEAGNINKSLLSLGTLISKLQSNPSGFVNYRDSKLTHVLMNVLVGNSLTVMICCITPHVKHFEVTKSTLEFAMWAKSVQIKTKINEVLDDRALLKRYENEIKELKEKNLQLLLNQRLIDEEPRASSFNRRLTWCSSLNTTARHQQRLIKISYLEESTQDEISQLKIFYEQKLIKSQSNLNELSQREFEAVQKMTALRSELFVHVESMKKNNEALINTQKTLEDTRKQLVIYKSEAESLKTEFSNANQHLRAVQAHQNQLKERNEALSAELQTARYDKSVILEKLGNKKLR